MKGKGPKSCKLKFEIDVDGAKIYLDGKRIKKDRTLTVLYGAHSLKVTAEGYDDWERTLYVNSEKATISLDISSSKKGSSSSTSTSGTDTINSGTSNSSTNSSTDSGNTSTDTNGSTVTTGNDSSTSTSSGTTHSERDKAQEDYLSTLANSIASTIGSSLSD
ncbi:MAG: PEGA domain-containing protein [Lachnospiraceae bacterium]|nr:PEGA domain-containing protein [Lachnospiraceae bacterium]